MRTGTTRPPSSSVGEGIAAPPLRGRCDARGELVAREIARAIDQHRELVGVARLRSPGAVPRRRREDFVAAPRASPRRRPRPPSPRRAARDRATAAPPAARRAACRRRTSSPSRSRTAATRANGDGISVATDADALSRRRRCGRARRAAPACRTRPAARRDRSRRRSGTTGTRCTACSRSSALSRWSQSGMRRRGLPRGSSSARAAFIRKRAPNSDDAPTSSRMSRSASPRPRLRNDVDRRRARRGPAGAA